MPSSFQYFPGEPFFPFSLGFRRKGLFSHIFRFLWTFFFPNAYVRACFRPAALCMPQAHHTTAQHVANQPFTKAVEASTCRPGAPQCKATRGNASRQTDRQTARVGECRRPFHASRRALKTNDEIEFSPACHFFFFFFSKHEA